MQFSQKVCFVLVAKNELIGLKKFLPILTKIQNSEIFVIDASTDNSKRYLTNFKKIKVFHQKKNDTISMFLSIILKKTRAKYFIFFQPDGNCDIKKIFRFNQYIKKNYDLIVASRYLKNAVSYDDSIITSIGNFFFTKIINIFFSNKNFNISDGLVGYRAMKIKTIKELNIHLRKNYQFLEKNLRTSLSWDTVMTCKVLCFRPKGYIEFPCSEPSRIGGVVKRNNLKWGISYFLQILYIFFTLKLGRR